MTVAYVAKKGGLLSDFANLRSVYENKGFSVSEIEMIAMRKGSRNPEKGLIHLHSSLSSMDRRDEYHVLGKSSISSLHYRHMSNRIHVPFLESRRENDYGSYMKMTNGDVNITMIANEGRGVSPGRLILGVGAGLFVSNGLWSTAMNAPEQFRPLLFLTGFAMGLTCTYAGIEGFKRVPPRITTTLEALKDENQDLEALASLAR